MNSNLLPKVVLVTRKNKKKQRIFFIFVFVDETDSYDADLQDDFFI